MVEVLIAMVLTLFIFMAVLSTAILAIDSNTKNMLRNEAARIAAQSMSGARSFTFANMQSPSPQGPAGAFQTTRNFRQNLSETYTISNAVAALDQNPNDHDEVTVKVTWNWKGRQQQYIMQSVVNGQ